MKKALFIFLLLPAITFSQCAIEDILVFEHGISKFDVIKKSKTLDGFIESKINAGASGKWDKPEYLTDSVFMDKHYFDVLNMKCYKKHQCVYTVHFADDKLFKQIIELGFAADSYEDFNEIYKKISQLFRLEFAFSKSITINQPGNMIKQGEGYLYTELEGPQEKTDQVKIYNTIAYKKNDAGVSTSEIEKYLIVIESVSLAGTKLDYRGY